ncbi:PQQ-binding-like beta-propeller repeat protein [Haloplanus sp. GCM10025708]|uniref:outer membrane protein assembly factor BamB family protein n=1 Tax=Haloferacaceae TaxID=1644056 RepID=UPI00360CBDB6
MVSRRITLRAAGALLGGVGAGCLGQSGPTDERIRWQKRVRGSPVLDGDSLYVLDRLTLYALSPTDGSAQWIVEYDESEFDERLCLGSALAVDDSRIYVPACDGLRALGRANGTQEWFVGSPLRNGVAVGHGRVYANGEGLLAIDAGSGSVDWRAPLGGDRLTRPAVAGDAVVVTNRRDGVVVAYDAAAERRWRRRTDVETRSPTVADGTVYVATTSDPGRSGRLLALDLSDGSEQWAVDTPSPRRGTRPVVGSDAVYLGCTGRNHGTLVALRRSDGSERWSFTDGNSGVYEPVVAGGTVYAGSNDDRLYAFSTDGDRRWTIDTGSTVGDVAVGDGLVYASNNERLLAVDRT